jgi:hypothetical protein
MSLGKEKKGGIKKLASSVGKNFSWMKKKNGMKIFVNEFIGIFSNNLSWCHLIGSKLRLPKSGGRDEKSGDGRLSRHSSGRYSGKYSSGEPDPGVISEDDDEFRVINLCFFPVSKNLVGLINVSLEPVWWAVTQKLWEFTELSWR